VNINGIAIGPSGNVYIDEETSSFEVATYEPSDASITRVGSGILGYDAYGLGVNRETGDLYVADIEHNVVFVFEAGEMPETPTTEPATQKVSAELKAKAEVLNGTLAPGATGYYFVYNVGTSCEGGQQTAPGAAVNGAVSAELTHLQPFAHYSFCLVATNRYGDAVGSALSFEIGSVAPEVTGESFSSVGLHTVTFEASVNPESTSTAYHFVYGTTGVFDSTTPEKTAEVTLAAESSPTVATAQITDLEPGTEYHVRIVARNAEEETTLGPELTFTTVTQGLSGLPDNRVYEMVSPVENHNAAASVQMPAPAGFITTTPLPFQASEDGNAVVYESDPTTGGNGWTGPPFGNTQLATRSPEGGWTQKTLESNNIYDTTNYQAFSSDLSVGVIGACWGRVLATNAPKLPAGIEEEDGYVGYNLLYTHDDSDNGGSGFSALFTAKPGNRRAAIKDNESYLDFGTSGVPSISLLSYECPNALVYAGASGDFSHLLFEANDSLLEGEGKLETELNSDVKTEIEEGAINNNLYVSTGWSGGTGQCAAEWQAVSKRDVRCGRAGL